MNGMDSVVGSQRPLAPLYRPDERFEISAAGLQEWYRSDCFRRLAAFYAGYPERSIFADNGRALMHHLIVMLRPERLLEIGTMYAGTTEVLARAAWEAGRGHVETLDPYGAERCPALIAEFLPELRERVTYRPRSSAIHLDQVIAGGGFYDFVLIDGSHELEFAAFDLECSARVMRPNGIIVLDNIEQVGPRFATTQFLERHPEWIDVAGVVGKVDANRPLARPMPSFPDCFNFLLQAPPYYLVGGVPRSFGNQPVDGGEVRGIELDLAAPADGILHVQAIVRTFGVIPAEELSETAELPLRAAAGPVKVPLPRPVQSRIADRDGIDRRVEVTIAFTDGTLKLKAPPTFYPARPR
jgi:predicted O-methyltransferase YrrM